MTWGVDLYSGRKYWCDILGVLNNGDSVTLIVDRSASCLFACKNSEPFKLISTNLSEDLYFACSMSWEESCLELVDE